MVPPARRYLKGHFNGIITHPWCSLVPLFTVLCATGTFIMGLASCYCLFSFFNILVLLCLLPWCFFLGILCLFFFIHFLSLLIRGLTQNFLPSMWRITACRWHRPSYFWISNLSTLRRIPLGISSEIFVQQLKASGNKVWDVRLTAAASTARAVTKLTSIPPGAMGAFSGNVLQGNWLWRPKYAFHFMWQ